MTAIPDEHFRSFAKILEREIARYDANDEHDEQDLLTRQKQQVETLVDLEDQFRQALIAHAFGRDVYEAFVRYICEEKRNVLDARPFFRERQDVFTSRISPALKTRDAVALYGFHFNYHFIRFAMQYRRWAGESRVARLAQSIAKLRHELVVLNMPLAISRSKIFWRKTPKAQLSYMDFVQISCEGLMSAVDKFVLPYSKVFRSVAIGRIVGNFIEQYSETLVHFYPVDKRRIYRANKVAHKYGDSPDFEKLADEVNKDVVEEGHKTTASEIQDLMAAASLVSADATTTVDEEEGTVRSIDAYPAPDSARPDVAVENEESWKALSAAIETLSLKERKLLQMRGVSL